MHNHDLENFNDEVSLKEIFLVLSSKKILITTITTLSAIFAVLYSLSLPNIYTSNALLAPTSSEDSLSNKLGSFSPLAGLAGLGLSADPGSKSSEAIARISSYDFFVNQFIPNIDFENLVAAKKWIKTSNTLNYDSSIFNKTSNKWVTSDKPPFLSKPSNQEAYEIYTKILTISEDKRTSFISISIEHISPFIAEKWLKLIIHNINDHMRELDKSIAKSSIDFLNVTAQKTNLSEMKLVISKLVENQVQILTLAESNKDYVFKAISSPIAPEKKSKPSRSSIASMGTFIGFMISIIISLLLYYLAPKKN